MYKLKVYNYDEELTSIDDMMIEKNFVKEIMFPQPTSEQLNEILDSLAEYEGYLYELYANEDLYNSGVVTTDALSEDLIPISLYGKTNKNDLDGPAEVTMPKIDEEGEIKGKIL